MATAILALPHLLYRHAARYLWGTDALTRAREEFLRRAAGNKEGRLLPRGGARRWCGGWGSGWMAGDNESYGTLPGETP